jgi:macrodomain Ter protein organizer (MatP/YcbG family)
MDLSRIDVREKLRAIATSDGGTLAEFIVELVNCVERLEKINAQLVRENQKLKSVQTDPAAKAG